VTGGGFEAYSYDPVTGSLANKAGMGLFYDDAAHLHAVSDTSNGESYAYDENGNMTQRNVLENIQTLTYDAEGRLTEAEITYTIWT
jgi:YD repeat-containing protein